MLTIPCINPKIMEALTYCGHGSKILIADGNYPLAGKSGTAKKVFLGVCPGIPTVTDVLRTLHSVIDFEKAEVMVPADGSTPAIFPEFQKELDGLELHPLGRFEFYDACMAENALSLAISTGEQRTFACILLTVGCAQGN